MAEENKQEEKEETETSEQEEESLEEESGEEDQEEEVQKSKEEPSKEGKPAETSEPAKEQAKEGKPAEKKERMNIVRVMETNLDGNRPVRRAIRRVRGVSFMFSNAVSQKIDFADRKLGEIGDSEIQKLEDVMTNPQKYGIPQWMCNRRYDPVTGEDRHLTVSALEFAKKMDINEMKKKKTYKGIRHSEHLTVRGQRTRGSFRKGKVVGVSRKAAAAKK
jgi:small subunit ribosomal protein S13